MDWLVVRAMRWRFAALGSLAAAIGSFFVAGYWYLSDGVGWFSIGSALLAAGFTAFAVWASHCVGRLLRDLRVQTKFESRRAFDTLYERSPVAYLMINVEGDIKLANTAAVHLLGMRRDSIAGQNFYTVLDTGGELSKKVLEEKVYRGLTITEAEVILRRLDATQRWAKISVFQPDNPQQRLVALADITEQKAVDDAKSEFVALATHQLRTPIAAIRWNVELLDKSLANTVTEKQAKYLTKVTRNVARMIHLINDFLSVSKLEMGTYAATSEEVGLEGYLEQILEEFEEKIVQQHLTVNRPTSHEDIVINTDRRLLHIIFSNLISNAVKYTNAGGTVTIKTIAAENTLELTVSDTGIGIPEEELPQLFTKFYRATNAQQQVVDGTGLGLYVVQQSVAILGGSIEVASARDKGTTFVVQLPGVVVSAR